MRTNEKEPEQAQRSTHEIPTYIASHHQTPFRQLTGSETSVGAYQHSVHEISSRIREQQQQPENEHEKFYIVSVFARSRSMRSFSHQRRVDFGRFECAQDIVERRRLRRELRLGERRRETMLHSARQLWSSDLETPRRPSNTYQCDCKQKTVRTLLICWHENRSNEICVPAAGSSFRVDLETHCVFHCCYYEFSRKRKMRSSRTNFQTVQRVSLQNTYERRRRLLQCVREHGDLWRAEQRAS